MVCLQFPFVGTEGLPLGQSHFAHKYVLVWLERGQFQTKMKQISLAPKILDNI